MDTAARVALPELRSALGYAYAHERDHRTVSDPWEYAFGDARPNESEAIFYLERDRVLHVLRAHVNSHWDAELLYYSPGTSSALYHWSSSEGTLHPYRTASVVR